MPETPEKDPITSPSLAGYYLIVAILLIASFGWSLYDEFYGLRPWKGYEREFARRYSAYLRKQIPQQDAAEKQITGSAEYLALDQKIKDLEAATKSQREETNAEARLIAQRLDLVTAEFTDARANVAAQIYDIEHESSPRRKKSLQDDLDKFERKPYVLNLPSLEGGRTEKVTFTYPQLEDEFKALQAKKAQLGTRIAEQLRLTGELLSQRNAYVADHLNGLDSDRLRGLLNRTKATSIEIRQINNPDAGIVDRCESCHAGIREPLVLARADMGGAKDELAAAFTSHPDVDLLKIHDPEKFGCTSCHGGNGMQVDSVETGHGEYEHWLWPLYHKGNVEAGCQQCHAADMFVDHAPVLSEGKDLFQRKGCVGCHRFQRYDSEPEDLLGNEKQIEQLERQRVENLRSIQRAIEQGDQAADNEAARKFYTQADALRVEISQFDLRIDQLDVNSKHVLMGMKKVGPDLKEARVKIKPEWIPMWITNPHAWRPTTKMPRFRLDRGEVEAVSAFIWQSALKETLPKQPAGDPVRGKESFETRGCMACHAVGEGSDAVGGTFAANLSRVGEKDNYDYLVRWIHNPRQRSRPYCTFEKRDLTEQDYKKHDLPFVFDMDHSKCPNDGHQIVVEQMTVMPNLRLSWPEARDIASYLITLKRGDAAPFPAAPFLNETKLQAEGRTVVKRYGCAGCHEIAGLEDEGRIGTELTNEGSKPIEQIDFALHIGRAKDQNWYSHKGFFEHKLARPEMFDEGMIKPEGEELRMPNFFEPVSQKVKNGMPELSAGSRREINALTTFLMGAVNSPYPPRYLYLPEDQRKDIQDGWWIVRKYNCMGCHQFKVGQDTVLMGVPRYQTPEWKDQLPPKLLTEGARVSPDWLLKFLSNPALSEKDTDRDGVRPYLKTRMPSFYFSPIELGKLVRFFQALSRQPMPYIPQKLEPLTARELEMARALFTSRAAPCLKCHATGDPAHDKFASAPNFLLARERLKPSWTKHWMLDPAFISPGTAMPSGLFKTDGGRNVFAGPVPPIFTGYAGDHADLLVRYMFEITPEEQRRLVGMSAGAMKASLPEAKGKTVSRLERPPVGTTMIQAH